MKNYTCKNCTERYLGCHDKCEEYQKIKKENVETKRKMVTDFSIQKAVKSVNLTMKRS